MRNVRLSIGGTDSSTNRRKAFASVRHIRGVFHEHQAELEWLAYFITGDREIAAACVTDACALSESHNNVFQEWVARWARYATIRSAIQTQRARIKQLFPKYDHHDVCSRHYEPLPRKRLELLVTESEVLVVRLDVLSRAALVICGIEGNSIADAALLLGISKANAQAAYRAALDAVDVIRCEHLCQVDISAVLCN